MAGPKQKPRNLFLDTQVFDRHELDLQHSNFITLANHVAKGEVRLFSTSVTVGEIRSHFVRGAEEAHEAIRSIKNKHPVVLYSKNPPVSDLFKKDKLKDIGDELGDELLSQFDEWLAANNVTVLPVTDVDPERVFEMYFEVRPPFGSGDKKSEFPDAFALNALWQWCVEHKQEIYVVSGDKGIGEFCSTFKDLKYVNRLSKFLEKIPDPALVKLLHASIQMNKAKLVESIGEAFVDEGLYVYGAEGQVHDIDVSSVELRDVFVVEAAKGQATAEIDCNISFTATVEYEEPGTGHYDKESGSTWYPDVETIDIEDDMDRTVIVSFRYDPAKSNQIDIESVRAKERHGRGINIDTYIYPDR